MVDIGQIETSVETSMVDVIFVVILNLLADKIKRSGEEPLLFRKIEILKTRGNNSILLIPNLRVAKEFLKTSELFSLLD